MEAPRRVYRRFPSLTERYVYPYLIALLAVAAATLMSLALQAMLQDAVSLLFLTGVFVAAWFGGWGPGLVSTVASTVLLNFLFLAPSMQPSFGMRDFVHLGVFVLIAVLTCHLHQSQRQAHAALHQLHQDERETLDRSLTRERAGREQAEQARRRSEEAFRRLFEEAPVAYHEIDRDGVVCRVNQAECDLLGFTAEEMLGKPIWEFVAPDEREVSQREVMRKLSGGDIPSIFYRDYTRRDGTRVRLEIHEKPIRDAHGIVSGMRSTLLDVTERKRSEDRISQLNAELEQRVRERTAELQRSNEALEQFAYAVSHDLQEPLRSVMMYAQLIERRHAESLDRDGREFLAFIDSGAQRMSDLISDLLEYSRVTTLSTPGPLASISSEEALRTALANLRFSIEESGAAIEFQVLPSVPADPRLLSQLFQNLVGNAIKYRGEDSPVVHIAAVLEGGYWKFSVRDNGIGLSPQHAESIFVIFKRLHGSEYPGTGVGLAICRRIVERHGGRIWVESTPGAGSTFYFTLPATGRIG